MSPQQPASSINPLGRTEAAIMAESALIDKVTGRVLWEGGSSSTLSESLYPKIGGLAHVKATVLTSLLLLILMSWLSRYIRQRLETQPPTATAPHVPARPFYQTVGLFIAQWTLLQTPNVDSKFVIFVLVLYLIEAYNCSTRRYLTNAITSPTEVEAFIEKLRSEPPVVSWNVRCFHYEKMYWMTPLKTMKAAFKALSVLFGKYKSATNTTVGDSDTSPVVQKQAEDVKGPFRRKVITHQAAANYTFSSYADATTAGVWKRQAAADNDVAPFMKIILSKILVLANDDAKKDYFKQQSEFVTKEGMRDNFAEYSTNIEVKGFKRRMLAIRPVEGIPSAKLFRLNAFWTFTLLGLSLPYRLWFARHCDYLRVSVVKETHAQLEEKSSFSSWFSYYKSSPATTSGSSTGDSVKEVFRQKMQSLFLYTKNEDHQSASISNNATKYEEFPTGTDTAPSSVVASRNHGTALSNITAQESNDMIDTKKGVALQESSTNKMNTTKADVSPEASTEVYTGRRVVFDELMIKQEAETNGTIPNNSSLTQEKNSGSPDEEP